MNSNSPRSSSKENSIKIKGVIGPAVDTALTILDTSPAAMDADTINIALPLRELFAVCEELNENIILTADTVNRLIALRNYESFVARTVVESKVKTFNIDNEIIDQNEEIENDEIVNEDVTTTVVTGNIGDGSIIDRHVETDLTSANTITLMKEQQRDPALSKYFDMVRKGNRQFFIRDGLLYHRSKVNGNKVEQLCLPQERVGTVLKIAHDLPSSEHQAV